MVLLCLSSSTRSEKEPSETSDTNFLQAGCPARHPTISLLALID